jgi:pimeloyl-ACP methyl ester carboxylesterase
MLAAGTLTAVTGGAYALIEAGILPGQGRVARILGRCGTLPGAPVRAPGPVQEHSLDADGGGTVRAMIGWPPGSAPGSPLPVTVLLHGGGGDARTPFDVYAIHRYLADAVARRVRPFAVAAVDAVGGWGDAGLDAITDVLLPALAERRLRTDRVGVLGWSMGGDGALSLAARLGRARTAAVVATSPAITGSSARTYAARLAGIPLWAGCGSSDSFAGPTEELLAALKRAGGRPAGGIYPGCHDAAFRRRMLSRQLTFLGTHLP